MDSITQGLLGAAIGEAGFRRGLGGRAVLWGAVMGVAPDFDMAAAALGEWETVLHHRGVTHSLPCQTAAAPLLGWLAWRSVGRRAGRWTQWAWLTWWALVTHPALDVCTAYGTQLLAPFDRYRHAVDAVSVVDPLYTLPLLVAAGFAWRGRDRARSRRVALGALVVTTLYLGLGWGLSQRAEALAEASLRESGFSPVEIRALPTLGNAVVHRVIARDGGGRFRVRMTSVTGAASAWIALADDDDPLVRRARRSHYGRLYAWFAMGFARFERVAGPEGDRVIVHDLRYGSLARPRRTFMGAVLRYDARGRLQDAERRPPPTSLDPAEELAALGAYLTGQTPARLSGPTE